MFDKDKIHISEIKSAIFVEASRHPDSKTVFCNNTPTPSYEMIYRLNGENLTVFNGKVMHTLPGCVYFLPKCQSAQYHVERTIPGDCIDIFFDTDTPFYTEAFMINAESNKKLHPLFYRLLKIWLAKKEGYYYKSMGIFYEILSELEKSRASYLPTSKYLLIEKGVDYLHHHFCDSEISYTDIAKLCGISYSYFKRLFTARFGQPPLQYVSQMKAERAKELLATGRYSVSEVSFMCGYSNVYYFSRAFKKQVGIPPSEYARQDN